MYSDINDINQKGLLIETVQSQMQLSVSKSVASNSEQMRDSDLQSLSSPDSRKQFIKPKIYIHSAYLDQNYKKQLSELGISKYLSKPANPVEIQKIVARLSMYSQLTK